MKYESNKKIAFLGGDMRATIAAMKLADKMDIYAWRTPWSEEAAGVNFCDFIGDAVSDAAAVILPLPSSLDEVTLNCKCEAEEEKIALTQIADMLSRDCIIIGGRLPSGFLEYTAKKQIKVFDYFSSEGFQIKNAYTTAEAALSIAMNNLSKNVRGASFALTGYGRISKQLVKLLKGMGAKVTVAARKESDLTWAKLEGCSTLNISNRHVVNALCDGYDIIFNTVPYLLFDEEFLKKVSGKTLIIELASSPGGIDISVAKKLRAKVLWAASLPGKYAPESAGELIADCVKDILDAEVIG